ncbi:hypothetical protein L1987_22975 [Smallanthus sonchifolius]|uniref:Uncharacterized protein n=1 Tax=Smallanthus sonchifolius TaxID=185202 RepID=A0ACB9IHU1_9ASTR|nr:hypothetical protein L1987_22975 [Smallanthus sonchifolius]
MVVVNHKVEDDNNTGSFDELARVNASKAADLKLEMIRLYEGGKFEDDNNHGSMVSASTKAEMELMIRSIYKDTICPMICAEIKRKHQNFLFMVREKFGLDLFPGMTWNFHNTESNLGSQSLQLMFLNGISTPVSTGKIIEGNEQKPFLVALVDGISGQIVTTGAEAAMEVEIVVLEGDSNDDEADNWTSDDFKDKIVSEWSGNKVLQGNTFVKLNEGIVSVDKISFTHNSVWKGKRKCRIGARSVNAIFPTRVKEAKTESFLVMDKRKLLYCKHEIPSLSDPVYRLKEISIHGDLFKQLSEANIKTVMDLLTIHAINPQRLRKIRNVCTKKWRTIMNHAKVCKDDKGIYLYHYTRDGQKSKGVAFNISGQLVGIIAESRFVSCDKLPSEERAEAQKLIVSSSEHWDKVAPFNDQDALINHLQPRTTVNSSFHNNLNVVIPQTPDPQNHTNLTSPTSQSQSPKRPASEHVISNSPKQPRYDHPKLCPFDAQKLMASSSELWEEVVPFNDQDSLINHLQSHTTVNPSFHNNLNVVIPQTTDPHNHTNLTSPKSQSQSPKRPASEHAISNSPKQPRYDHPKLSPSYAHKLIASSSEHWEEAVPFNDQDSLINHLQSHTTVNPSFHNNLNVVIPYQTTDPHNLTNFTSPKSQSQSPKSPASEHAISNSLIQPRYEHPRLSPSMPSVGMDTSMRHNANNLEIPLDDDHDHDHLKYLNLGLRDGRWKIVWCAVGWISMILELRRRRTTSCHHDTLIVLAASMEHEGTCD